MPNVHAFHVVPALPDSLQGLRTLAYNLRWAWDHETIELFRRLDRDLWETSGHNPVWMLGTIAQDRLRDAGQDDAFLVELDRLVRNLDSYLKSANTWFQRHHGQGEAASARIGYFSMEFGLTECIPVYSGGLGVLSGDHLKSASDLGLPLVAVGLLYQQGYFRQFLNRDGWQEQRYPENDFYNLPLTPERDANDEPLRIGVEFPGRTVWAQVWRAQVGRVPLYLLDTNIDANAPTDQNITDKLYGGDREMRIQQEMILGVGGIRALAALGIEPTVCHMNEGHSAFLALERTRRVMETHGVTYWQAREATAAGSLFTTHTPVPAGFDMFSSDQMGRYLGGYAAKLGLSFDDLMNFGRVRPNDGAEFNMAIMALRHSHYINGVSKLHGAVSRKMVQVGFPGWAEHEIPIQSVTNGIHTRSFISSEMADLLDRYLGGRWSQDVSDEAVWAKIDSIPDEELWRVRERRRDSLVRFARMRLQSQYEAKGRSAYELRMAREVLNPEILTLGFARRFATYKRATLLLHEPERLKKLLNDPHRPVQILFAGKSHPRDDGGKELISQVVAFAQNEDVRKRIVFIEDYDLTVARFLVQGVDIWLNTPRRPMEASGTSGMKVLANGGLNVSIPDGWWAEAYNSRVGWSVGHGEDYTDTGYQDHVEALALYDTLEKEVVPLFYDRSGGGIPRAWIARIKNSMRELCPVFNTHRMVSEYAERFYFPASLRHDALMSDGLARAKSLVAWKLCMREEWSKVKIESVETKEAGKLTVRAGMPLHITAQVRLGGLQPSDVAVQVYHGMLDINHNIASDASTDMLTWQGGAEGLHTYAGEIPCQRAGQQGFAVRVIPTHPDAELPQELPLITWE